MLTNDPKISTPEYWKQIFEGKHLTGNVDRSDTKRAPNAFDRFQWLADQVEGPTVLDIASGHAVTCKRIKAKHPDWDVLATDQTEAAKKAANYAPYFIVNAYDLSKVVVTGAVTTVTISQALEYLERPDDFMKEVRRIAKYFVCTVPEGEMKVWSQLRIYEEESFKDWLREYGNIIHFDKVPGLMLAKIELK
jgi:ubiquinone/menaquinone biosynthesis C-methylase UbiE